MLISLAVINNKELRSLVVRNGTCLLIGQSVGYSTLIGYTRCVTANVR